MLCLPCLVNAATTEAISVVYNQGIAPIKFVDPDGEPSGILNDYWKLVAKKSEQSFSFHQVQTFGESLEQIRNGEIDLHAGVFYSKERTAFLEYSLPVFDLQYYIYSSPELAPPISLQDTKGLIVGVVKGGFTENHLKSIIPLNQLAIHESYSALFEAVLKGELKTFVSSDIHLNYYLSSHNLENPFKHNGSVLFEQTYYGATAKKNRSFMENIKAGQQLLTEKDRQELKDKWLHYKIDRVVKPKINNLTSEEIAWIKAHPVLKVSNELDWPPFDFNEDGKPLGLSIDLLQIISKRIGIELSYIHGYSWSELLEMIRLKQIDIIHSLNRSASREQFILFSDPYISNQTVIVTSKDNHTIRNFDDLHNKKIAVIDGYNQKEVLRNRFEGVQFVSVKSPLEALKTVSSGQVDATIRFNGVASYLSNYHLLTNLKFVGEFKTEEDDLHQLSIGVRDDWPMLQQIIQKGLDSVTIEEMNNLKRKWISMSTTKVQPKISFSEDELRWIQEHPEVTFGADYKWPPFEFADKEGGHKGLSSDYIKVIEQRTGLKINVRIGIWDDIIIAMQNKELDGLACAVQTEERKKYLIFSTPYLSIPSVIITKNDDQEIHNLDDLKGKLVAVNKGSYLHDWLMESYPDLKLHLTTSNEASLEAVSYGEADAYIGNLAVSNYIIRERLLPNLQVVKKLDSMITKPTIAVAKENTMLMGIIQKALDSIAEQERQEILDKWYITTTEQKLKLTDTEKEWLKENPTIKFAGDPSWAPVSFIDNKGKYAGIVPAVFKLIENKTTLEFKLIKTNNWSESLGKIADNTIHMLDAISEDSERRKLVDFTDVYMTADVAFITRDDVNYIKNIEGVGDKVVGTVKDYVTESYIRKKSPEMKVVLYENAVTGLKKLANGKIDVFVIDIPSFEYYARKSGLSNLKISGLTSFSFKLAIGVNKKHPELVSILNKALGLISHTEKNDIYHDWVKLEKPLVDYSLLWKSILAACVLLIAVGYWNRRLTHEVSLRKKAEDKALQASRAKSDFLANMSHEIRTPMNSVLGFAELLDNIITDPEQKSYLKSIRTGGQSLLGIINDILDLSKIEANKMVLKTEPVSMEKIFMEMEDFFTNKMAIKKLVFLTELDPDYPKYVLLDGIRFRQVLINLIENARKFTETGSVTLFCDDLVLDGITNTIDFSITVKDTGVGIAEDQQQMIFQNFEQLEGQDGTRYGGTGLGLSISKNLTTMMGGTISLESVLGKGSSFILRFREIPLAESEVDVDQQKSLIASGFQESVVLVVDDVQDNRTLVVEHFRESQIVFHQAENGQDALEILKKVSIDLVFLDLRMPVLNGYELITAMKLEPKLQGVTVIAVTASVMGDDLEKVHKYGFDGYLRKPVSRNDLFRVAANYLSYQEVEEETVVYDLSLLDQKNVSDFLGIADNKLLPEYQSVKDRGDFSLIDNFATNVGKAAKLYSIPNLQRYAEELQQLVISFDIIEVDILMKQFPDTINTLKELSKA